MRSRWIPALTTVMAVVFLAGCASRIERVIVPPASPDAATAILRESFQRVNRFKSRFEMGFNIGPVRGSFNGTCRLEPPDLLAVEISGPFGLRMGRLTMRGENFELEAGGNVYHGLVDTLDIEQLTGFPVPEKNPLILFSPVASPPSADAFFLNFSESGDTLWTLEVYEDKQVHVYELDPGRKLTLRELWKTEDGELLFEKTYLDYRDKKGALLPEALNFVVPGDVEATIKLEYKSPEVNPVWKKDPFQFRLNPS